MLYELPCPHCRQAVSADSDFSGRRVRCPHCRGEFELSPPPAAEHGLGGSPLPAPGSIPAGSQVPLPAPPAVPAAHRFGFTCTRCESVLEAHTGLCGRQAKCPTCATEFLVPHFDPKTGAVGELQVGGGEAQDPTPVHAYAADGARAPEIVRNEAGEQIIRCPRCEQGSPVDVVRCQGCGLPFTLEGVTHDARPDGTNGYAVASLAMGLLGLPCFVLVVPQALAIVFGIVGLNQVRHTDAKRGSVMASVGITLGTLSLVLAGAAFLVRR